MKHITYLILWFVLLVVPSSSAMAEPRIIPESRSQSLLSFAPVVKKVSPAVVNIYTRKIVKQRLISPFMDDPMFQQFFGGSFPQGMTRQRMENSLGSGVLVSNDGMIVTNNHVTAGADQITVVLHDRREFEAKLVTSDEHTDLAVLRIDTKDKTLPFLELGDSDAAEVGDLVLAIGNPFGVGQTVTSGIISAIARTAVDINDLNYFIQTDAAINPGNSGGALVNTDGKLIGINSAIFSRSGGNMGIGFAIPSNMIPSVMKSVSEGKKNIVRPWIGLSGQDVTSEIATSLNLSQPTGVLVNAVSANSPAKRAGLRVGDVVVSINGKAVEDPEAFRFRIATLPIGSKAVIEFLRGGQKINATVELMAPPEDPPREPTLIKGNNPLSGATIANISPAVIEEMGLRGVEQGVVVVKIDRGVAANVGITPGDIILSINGEGVKSVKKAGELLQGRFSRWSVSINRGGNVLNIMVNG